MKPWLVALLTTALAFGHAQARQPANVQADTAPHKAAFLTTSDGVRLEVLDFGGSGSPVILIAGYGNTAHAFDGFAPKLATRHRVYAVTRRASGRSDTPPLDPANYEIGRLAKDVIEVMDQLKLDRATLVGWSFGGAELSAIGHHFKTRATALVYLDAAYAYAFYAPGNAAPDASNVEIGLADLRNKLRAARMTSGVESERLYEEVLSKDLADLETDIRAARDRKRQLHVAPSGPPAPASRLLMRNNMEKFGPIEGVRILAIFAPPVVEAGQSEAERADTALEIKWAAEQIGRYRAAHPQARVIELPGADHAVFNSHPDVVLREIEGLLAAPSPTGQRR